MATAAVGRFKTSLETVPLDYVHQYSSLKRSIAEYQKCALCSEMYSGSQIGTLVCKYHPFQIVNTSTRFVEYHCHSGPPTNCKECNTAHLSSGARRTMHWQIPGDETLTRTGCTPVDHCADLFELLSHPYKVVPLCMAEEFLLHDRVDDENYMSSHERNNVLVVDSPEQMALTFQMSMPGTNAPVLIPVVDLYDEVSEIFSLDDLQRTVRLARRGPNPSSITRIKGMRHPDALDIYRLYSDDREAQAEFMPFVVVARVHQYKPMELVDIPELVTVVGDDQLV